MENNVNNIDISKNEYNTLEEETNETNIKSDIKKRKSFKNEINEKNKIFNNIKKINRESSLIRSTLNEKVENNSRLSELSMSKRTLIDEDEESKNMFLNSFTKQKDEINNQYLTPKYWKYKNKSNHAELEKKFEKIKNNINKDEIRKLYNDLKIVKLEGEDDSNDLKIKKLDALNEIKEKDEEKLKENIFKIRKIYKDNNNFYRCVIFSLFENMILTNNILFFKELLIEIDSITSSENNKDKDLFQDENLKNELQLYNKVESIKKLIYILIKTMQKSINSSYELLIKLYLLKQAEFDLKIILLIRYLLCFYINENKYKTYSKEEKIDLIELIPQKYKEMHIFLQKKFELFFLNDLLKLKSYDSKIIHYLLPYFFDINLNIIYYYPDSKNAIYQKQYGKQFNNNDDDDLIINLFYYKSTFNIYYTYQYYDFHKKILSLYETNKDNNIVIKDDIININKIEQESINNEINEITFAPKFICKNCNKEYNNEKNKENILKLCPECLSEEFKDDIYKLFLLYLQYVNHNDKNYKLQIDNYFYLMLHKTEIKPGLTLFQVMNESDYLIYKEVNKIKKDICLICRNNNIRKNYYYKLPCGCRFCCKSCFNKYLEIMIKKHYEKMCNNSYKKMIFLYDFCICGKKYYYDDIIILYNFLKEKQRINECHMIIKIVKNRWYWKCAKCDQNFDPFCLNKRLYLTDDKINKDFYGKHLKHLICSNCFDMLRMRYETKIDCNYCQSKHTIIAFDKLSFKNKDMDSCANF